MTRILALALWLCFSAIAAAAGATLLHACGVFQAMPLNFCPAALGALSADAQRQGRLQAQLARLQRELADSARQCAAIPPPESPPLELPQRSGAPRPQQVAALRPPPPPPPPPAPRAPVDLDAERWKNKDLGVLEGCWRLGQDMPMDWRRPDGAIIETNCTQRAGRLCFDRNGNGTNEESGFCPSGRVFDCLAPMTAHFAPDGSLLAQHPAIANACNTGPIFERRFVCQRIDDTKAVCERYFRFGHDTVEFRR